LCGTCLHTMSDKDHHGGGATNPSGGVDLMNPCPPRGGRPCTYFFQGPYQMVLTGRPYGVVRTVKQM
jgi:hypothetical protein